jgi:hypothetical protein
MAPISSLRHPWHPLLRPYRTHVLCPLDLCPHIKFPRSFGGFCGQSRPAPLSQDGRGRGFDKAVRAEAPGSPSSIWTGIC